MKLEKEITVLVETNYKELNYILKNNGFEIKEEYQLNDIYMINKDINIKEMKSLDILKKCILIRDVIGIEKKFVYKYKEYNDNGDILKQGKVSCPILDIDKGISFMEAINYKKLFSIKDKCIVYANKDTEIIVQLVNNEYIFIEMEDEPEYINKKYNTIEEMIKDLEKYNIPYDKNNYFVKKAELILNKTI